MTVLCRHRFVYQRSSVLAGRTIAGIRCLISPRITAGMAFAVTARNSFTPPYADNIGGSRLCYLRRPWQPLGRCPYSITMDAFRDPHARCHYMIWLPAAATILPYRITATNDPLLHFWERRTTAGHSCCCPFGPPTGVAARFSRSSLPAFILVYGGRRDAPATQRTYDSLRRIDAIPTLPYYC